MSKDTTKKRNAPAPKTSSRDSGGRDWRETLFLPRTDFPMKAGLPVREPKLLERWQQTRLYDRLREDAAERPTYILHDGPPYANGHLHIGHALNKILKDIVIRSQQMMGKNALYVPGWDCHGLPIEWKIEEKYRKKKRNKDEVPVLEFREECRAFANQWIDVQRAEFKRLGVLGDWDNPYTTMTFAAEARIASELMKFAMNGTLYQGSKPVMWSVVERTALAEAEVDYEEHESPTIFVRFAIDGASGGADVAALAPLRGADIVIWTTTPWTIPGNRGIAFSPDITYSVYRVTQAPEDNWLGEGERVVLADALAEKVMAAAKVAAFERVAGVDLSAAAEHLACLHPFRDLGFDFKVPVLPADFVTDETGTGFVHIAPGHGADDYGLFMANRARFAACGTPEVPHTVDEDGRYFAHVPYFGGSTPKRVIDDRGRFGDANAAVIEALIKAGALVARGKLRHQYPHSWRSKKPVIFRNTPQWFIGLDKPLAGNGANTGGSIRQLALDAIAQTRFVPETGRNRIAAMVENRPDWVVSRQRAWGVPITLFVEKATGNYIPRADFAGASELVRRIEEAFAAEGADAWFKPDAKARFLEGLVEDPDAYEQVMDILDVWFDSGSTHAFVLEDRPELSAPADLYLEGSDQHRGWFQSSLLESCGTRGRAPYKAVLTHGFLLDEKGTAKMSKSKGNALSPEQVTRQNGAEILRLWVASSDYWNDIRFGPGILQANTDSYRKLRNTLRFMLGNLAHFEEGQRPPLAEMPELERYILHRLHSLDQTVREAYQGFDFKRVFAALFNFCVTDLSSFYFDIRKDTLYCDPYSSQTRRACLSVLDELFSTLTAWLAPIMVFTMEEAWLARHGEGAGSVHLRQFPSLPEEWAAPALAKKWDDIRKVRRVVTGALEVERRAKTIGSSLEAAPEVFIADKALLAAFEGLDAAEIFITSGATLTSGAGPDAAFTLPEVPGVAVVFKRAEGRKCARSWKISPRVGEDPAYPDLSPRDAEAVRQFDAARAAAQ